MPLKNSMLFCIYYLQHQWIKSNMLIWDSYFQLKGLGSHVNNENKSDKLHYYTFIFSKPPESQGHKEHEWIKFQKITNCSKREGTCRCFHQNYLNCSKKKPPKTRNFNGHMEAVVMSWNPKELQSPGTHTQLLTLLYESSVSIWVIVMKQHLGKLRVSRSLRIGPFPQVRLGLHGDGNRAGCREKFYEHGWMASPTQWTWVWGGSGSWWWTGKSDVLQSVGSQRVRHDRATELNWLSSALVQSRLLQNSL